MKFQREVISVPLTKKDLKMLISSLKNDKYLNTETNKIPLLLFLESAYSNFE